MVEFNGNIQANVSSHPAIAWKSNSLEISEAGTNYIYVTLGQACDILGFEIEWSERIPADRLSYVKVVSSGDSTKHVLFTSSSRYTPLHQILSRYSLQPLFKGALATDKLKVAIVSTTDTEYRVNVDVQVAQAVQTA